MSVAIASLGWVTPLGGGLDEVWVQLREGVIPETKTLSHPLSGRALPHFVVPPATLAQLQRNPRLRRSSTISYLGVAAGLAAIENSGLALTPELAERTAVVFAIADGGVAYTRRFYEQIVKEGANAASPLLFPETVYNAPASHLAAQLGINGASYTLVGDASVGLAALHFGGELLATEDVDQVVVVGAEEIDWILCDAYREWRLARTPLAEGAAALVLRREGRWQLQTHPGAPFFRRCDAAAALRTVLADLATHGPVEVIVNGHNGTFVDQATDLALAHWFPKFGGAVFSPKRSLGEAPGAGALQQVVVAAMALEKLKLSNALVPVIGWNQQAGGARITAPAGLPQAGG